MSTSSTNQQQQQKQRQQQQQQQQPRMQAKMTQGAVAVNLSPHTQITGTLITESQLIDTLTTKRDGYKCLHSEKKKQLNHIKLSKSVSRLISTQSADTNDNWE